ncbi:right-handed parallel beta-helix repeat-containing protein [Methylorubrum suomiense]
MQSVTPKDGDHFIGEHGAVLNGARLITEFDREGHNWVATGQNQEGFRSGTEFGARGAERPGYPETFFIDNKPLTPVDSLDKVAPGKFYFDYGHDKIYFRDDPAGHRVEAGVSPFAIAGQAKDVHVENLVVEKYNVPTQAGAIGYNSSAEGWTIQNNEVRLNYGVGVYAGSNSHVTGNYVHDNGQMGLGASGDNVRVEGNEIAHNGYFSGIDRGWEGGGTKFAETENLIVRDNYSHDNNGYGLWTDINNINTLYEGNTVANNLSGGINHEISYAATIRDNVLTGNGGEGVGWLWNGGIQIQNSKNVDVYRNYVDASEGGNAITMIQQDRGTGSHGAWTTTGNSVHDNVIVDRTPGEGPRAPSPTTIRPDWPRAATASTTTTITIPIRPTSDGPGRTASTVGTRTDTPPVRMPTARSRRIFRTPRRFRSRPPWLRWQRMSARSSRRRGRS